MGEKHHCRWVTTFYLFIFFWFLLLNIHTYFASFRYAWMVLQHLSELWGLQLLALYYLSLSFGALKISFWQLRTTWSKCHWSLNENLCSLQLLYWSHGGCIWSPTVCWRTNKIWSRARWSCWNHHCCSKCFLEEISMSNTIFSFLFIQLNLLNIVGYNRCSGSTWRATFGCYLDVSLIFYICFGLLITWSLKLIEIDGYAVKFTRTSLSFATDLFYFLLAVLPIPWERWWQIKLWYVSCYFGTRLQIHIGNDIGSLYEV